MVNNKDMPEPDNFPDFNKAVAESDELTRLYELEVKALRSLEKLRTCIDVCQDKFHELKSEDRKMTNVIMMEKLSKIVNQEIQFMERLGNSIVVVAQMRTQQGD